MNITLIGDAHGKMDRLVALQSRSKNRTIQLGDMGFGFVPVPKFDEKDKFIRGNHDDPAKARQHKNYLGDFGYLPQENMFYIGGANSIDKQYRVPMVSWWPDEELSVTELNSAFQLYTQSRPAIVISHECPAAANKELLRDLLGNYFSAKGALQTSRTCQVLQQMLEVHQPKLWVFGHYHVDKTFLIGGTGTTFKCLAELSTLDIDTACI